MSCVLESVSTKFNAFFCFPKCGRTLPFLYTSHRTDDVVRLCSPSLACTITETKSYIKYNERHLSPQAHFHLTAWFKCASILRQPSKVTDSKRKLCVPRFKGNTRTEQRSVKITFSICISCTPLLKQSYSTAIIILWSNTHLTDNAVKIYECQRWFCLLENRLMRAWWMLPTIKTTANNSLTPQSPGVICFLRQRSVPMIGNERHHACFQKLTDARF